MSIRVRSRSAFTLVELLVVILIIGILMALLYPVMTAVIRRGSNFAMATDLNNLEMAIVAYKDRYKDFPPDFTDAPVRPFNQTVAYRHIRKAFPRIDAAEMTRIAAFAPSISAAESLVFWLGGLSKNPRQPFTGAGGPLIITGDATTPIAWRIQDRAEPLFTFDESRLHIETTGTYTTGAAYLPSGGNTTPYVYFDSRTYGFTYTSGSNQVPGYASFAWQAPDGTGWTVALPYKSDTANTGFNPVAEPRDFVLRDRAVHFVNRDTFQIVCAGIDGEFGPRFASAANVIAFADPNGNTVPFFTRFPSGGWYHPSYDVNNPPPATADVYQVGQNDNLANFSEGQTMKDAR